VGDLPPAWQDETLPPRLLLIALDSLPPLLLQECLDAGMLPNLSRLREEGRFGVATSTAGAFPAAVWPTFFTRSDVSVHGHHHLMQWDETSGRLRPPGKGWCEVVPFWQALAAAGSPVITFDVPFSDTGRSAPNVTAVIGWGMHEGVWHTSHPKGLLGDLERRHGRAAQPREGPGERPDTEITRELDFLVADVGRRANIIEDLATRFDWRLFLVAFSETHRAGHWFWGERGTGFSQGGVKAVLRAFDRVLPRLRRLLRPQDHLVVFSVHGMAAAHDIDRFGQGSVRYISRTPSAATTRRDPVLLIRRALPESVVRSIARRLPQVLYNWAFYRLQNNRRDWKREQWVLTALDHLVYVYANRGRQARMPRLEGERRAAIIAEFEAVTTADGQPAMGGLFRPADVYKGPRVHLLPDFIVSPVRRQLGPDFVLADGTKRRFPRNSSRDGEHVSDGFYIQVGPGISRGEAAEDVPGERLAEIFLRPAGLAVPVRS